MTKHDPLQPNARVAIGGIEVANDAPLVVFAGPCQMESRAHALEMAAALKERPRSSALASSTNPRSTRRTAPRFPASAASGSRRRCRFSPRSARRSGCPSSPTSTTPRNARSLAPVVDVLQIPAFLCRQTDLLVAAAQDRPRRQGEEGAVPGALGHEERRRQDRRLGQPQRAAHRARLLVRLQHARHRHARACRSWRRRAAR